MKGRNVSKIITLCHEIARRPMPGPLHVLIMGVPNTGKSSLINSLRGRGSAAKTGAKPGLTRTIGNEDERNYR